MRATCLIAPLLRGNIAILAIVIAGLLSLQNARLAEAAVLSGDPPARFEPANPAALDSDIASRLEELRSSPGSWGWHELIERGRLAVAKGDLAGAASVFESASVACTTDAERVVALYYWSTSLLGTAESLPSNLSSTKMWSWTAAEEPNPRRVAMVRLAGELLNQAQQLAPMSREVAATRVMAWSMLGDELETRAAEHQLRVIDPSLEGTSRNTFVAASRVVVAICKLGRVILTAFEFNGCLEPQQRIDLLVLLDAGAAAAEAASRLSSAGEQR